MKQRMNIRLSDTSRAALERLAARQGFEKAGRGNVSGRWRRMEHTGDRETPVAA